MGTKSYPTQYPLSAIVVAEQLVKMAAETRLKKFDEWHWTCPRYFLSSKELNGIRLRFAPGVEDETLLRFVGLVFSKVSAETHYEFVSDGYCLRLGGGKKSPTIALGSLPATFHGYENVWQKESYLAALTTVNALVNWKLTSFRSIFRDNKWPVGVWGGADLIHGSMYRWIKGIGEFGYCRTKNVIEFLYAAIPDIKSEWEADGLKLVPVYHVDSTGGNSTSLRLIINPAT